MENVTFLLWPDCTEWLQLKSGMETGVYEVLQGGRQGQMLPKRHVRHGVISVRVAETSWKLLFHSRLPCCR